METHKEWIGGLKSRVSPLKSLVSPLNRGLGSAKPGSDYAMADFGDVPAGGDVQGGDLGRKAGIRTRKGPGAESNCRHADFQSHQPNGWKGQRHRKRGRLRVGRG